MAWIAWKHGIAHVQWRDKAGRVRSRSARTRDPKTADLERRKVEREEEGRTAVPPTVSPRAALGSWLDRLRAAGRGAATIDGYADKVGVVVDALADVPLATWTAEGCVAPILSRPGWGATTKAHAVGYLAAFLAWCRRARLPIAPGLPEEVRDAERPSVRIAEREVLTEAQLVALVDAARGTVMEAAVALAGLAGLALADLTTLRADEVNLKTGRMLRRMGRSKTGERYDVPLAPRVVEAVRPWLASSGLALPLPSRRALNTELHRLFARAGIVAPRGGAWHLLRHSFGTLLGQRGVPLATIRRLMGHAPGSVVTLRYLHDDEDRAREAVAGIGRPTAPGR